MSYKKSRKEEEEGGWWEVEGLLREWGQSARKKTEGKELIAEEGRTSKKFGKGREQSKGGGLYFLEIADEKCIADASQDSLSEEGKRGPGEFLKNSEVEGRKGKISR